MTSLLFESFILNTFLPEPDLKSVLPDVILSKGKNLLNGMNSPNGTNLILS